MAVALYAATGQGNSLDACREAAGRHQGCDFGEMGAQAADPPETDSGLRWIHESKSAYVLFLTICWESNKGDVG